MIESIDQIIIGVNDVQVAAEKYQQLLGRQPSWRGHWSNFDCDLIAFQLSNCSICLCSPAGGNDAAGGARELVDFLDGKGEGIFALIFASSDLSQTKMSLASKGVKFGPVADLTTKGQAGYKNIQGKMTRIVGDSFLHLRAYIFEAKDKLTPLLSELCRGASDQDAVIALDHVVVNSADVDALRDSFAELGLNLRLDQNIQQWGARQLFYRVGETVLEVIAFNDEKLRPQVNEYWGLALQATDIGQLQARMMDQGVRVSKVRTGRKPGTLVASLKSHNLGVATLLIGSDLNCKEKQ